MYLAAQEAVDQLHYVAFLVTKGVVDLERIPILNQKSLKTLNGKSLKIYIHVNICMYIYIYKIMYNMYIYIIRTVDVLESQMR